jgi:CheY-like chemotaxis protein
VAPPPTKPVVVPSGPPIKVVVIDDETQILMLVKHALERTGFSVVTVNDPLRALETCVKELPRIIVSDLMMPRMDGYSIMQALRGNPLTAAIPVVFLSAAPPEAAMPRAFQHGCVGYFEKPFHPARLGQQLKDLLADLASRRNQMHGSLRRTPLDVLLQMMERERRSGVLELKTPEGKGRVVFTGGRVSESSYGGNRGAEGLAQLKALTEGEFKLSDLDGVQADIVELKADDIVEAKTEAPAPVAAPQQAAAKHKGSILIVDDEPDILKIMERALTMSGYDVSVATNGRLGLMKAVEVRPDIIICDIMMPEMDGWQMYHAVRADFRVNEARFIFLSAYPDLEVKLREVGVTADGYVAKGTMLGQLIQRIDALLRPRTELAKMIATGLTAVYQTRIEAIGIKHALRLLNAARFSGTLRVENIWHKITAEIAFGQPASVEDTGMVESSGTLAFEELCAQTNGELWISPESARLPANIDVAFDKLMLEAERDLTEAEQRVVDTNLVTAQAIRLDMRVLDFYIQLVPQRILPILQAVRAGKPPKEIMATIDLPPTEIEDVLRDLVRKKIFNFDAA